jgi:hypothetical protein
MNAKHVVAVTVAMLISVTSAGAGLEPFKDYVASKEVYNVTLVKVKPNRIDEYLAGLEQTWVGSCEVGKKLGQVVECSVLVSNNPGNSDYNVLLLTRSPSAAVGDPDQAQYEKFEVELRKKLAEDKERALVEGYEEMRTIVGDQDLRRIDFK